VVKIHPSFVKETAPIANDAFHSGACVKLHANRVKNEAKVRWEVHQSSLVDLKGVGMLMDGHAWENLWVPIETLASLSRVKPIWS
jgi:hypothetical protein